MIYTLGIKNVVEIRKMMNVLILWKTTVFCVGLLIRNSFTSS